jgi:mucin-19
MIRRRFSLCVFAFFLCVGALAQSVNYTFTHFAGPQSGPGSADGTGSAAQFAEPNGVAVDASGNIYVADTQNHTIRKVTTAGVVTTLAGQPTVTGYTDGTGSAARFAYPYGIVMVSGTLYVADSSNRRIRQVTTAGVVTTFAGSGAYGSLDGSATTASFSYPTTLAYDPVAGVMYVADNETIRKITLTGTVTTIAGSPGVSGAVDANGSAARFSFFTPGIAADSGGNVYVADRYNDAIRKIAPNGDVTTFAGTMGQFGSVDATGSAARFGTVTGLVFDASGNLYVNDSYGPKIRKITSAAVVTTFAGGAYGPADGTGTSAQFENLKGLTIDGNGTLYFADEQRVRQVTQAAVVTSLAGQPRLFGNTDASGSAARFSYPEGVVADSAGNLYVTDSNNNRIRKITPAGVVSTFAGTNYGFADGTGTAAMFRWPSGIAIDSAGTLYVTDYGSQTVRMITAGGVVTTIAGSDQTSGSTDGTGSGARFNFGGTVDGIAVDSAGNIYVADANNHTIRKIAPGGVVTTFAGTAGLSGFADGTGSVARFNFPQGLAVDTSGNLYVADQRNERIRRVTPSGVVTTLAGSNYGYYGVTDGFGSSAQFANLLGISVDSSGKLYVTDGYTIRSVTQAGLVTTLGGRAFVIGTSDGVGGNGLFHYPAGITVDASGNLYVIDPTDGDVRKAVPAACTAPNATITTASAICAYATGTASVADAGAGATYAWSISGGSFNSSANGSSVSYTAGSSGSVTLNVMVMNASSCQATATATVIINALPSASITLSPSSNICPGTTVTASVPDAGTGASYSWFVSGGTITAGSGTSSITFTATAFGSVSVTVRNAAGCASTSSRAIPTSLSATIDKQGFGAAGDTGTVTVTNPSSCSFTSSSSASWLTITAGGSGSGSGPVTFAVAANSTSAPRGALLTVAGFRFAIYQAGNGASDGQSYSFSHLAGSVTGAGFADGSGSAARFSYPSATAVDSAGNVYVADTWNHVIRKITAAGATTTLAGSPGLAGGVDGTGAAARFYEPQGIAVDSAGNVYVADSGNYTIRKITPAGAVSTLAGLAGASGVSDGIGSAARFSFSYGLVVDASGTMYVADGSATIRQITSAGVVTTIAGSAFQRGEVDGTGSAARFDFPRSITVDSTGNLFVVDENGQTVRKIAPGGVVTTFAGQAYTYGSSDGTGPAARFDYPAGITIDSAGNLYLSDSSAKIRKITPGAVVSTLAGGTYGSADGTGTAAQFRSPLGISADASGVLYVADNGNHTIRKVTSAGAVTTLSGSAPAFGSTDGSGSSATFNFPEGVAVDGSGNAYVADTDNHVVRKITNSGVVSTFAGSPGSYGSADGPVASATFSYPGGGIAVDSAGSIYVADVHAIRKISGGTVTTIAGVVDTGGSADGTGSAARFSYVYSMAVDSSGTIYVADYSNQTIRKITSAGVVTTIAGRAGVRGYADGVGTAALFNYPDGIAIDGSGNLYVGDDGNNVLRKIAPDGTVSTLAGSVGLSGIVDGSGAQAAFTVFYALAVDASGNIFVGNNNVIRKVTSAGLVTTVAGLPLTYGNTDGVGAAARFLSTWGIAVDATGKLYIADPNAGAIRLGVIAGVKGDANGDGLVTVGDVFYLINYLFAGGPAPLGPADVNGDGQVTVGDVFYLINYLFAGGPAPL